MPNDIITKKIKLIDEKILIDDKKIEIIKGIKYHVYYVHYPYTTIWCKNCGCLVSKTKNYVLRTIKTFRDFGYPVIFKYRQRRLICSECGKTMAEQNSLVSKGCNISNYLKLEIIKKCAEKQSFKTIAKELNIDSMTVINIFRDNVIINRKPLSEVLCVDEFSANIDRDNQYAFIIGDPIGKRIIDILPSKHINDLIHYFFKIPKNELNQVKIVNMDMWEPYRTVFETVTPNAKIAVDPFHYIKHATDCFNKLRIRIENETDNPKIKHLLKSHWKLFNLDENKINEKIFYSKILTCKVSNRKILEYCINSDRRLEDGWCILQKIYRFRKYGTEEKAPELLREIINRIEEANIEEMNVLAKTYSHWFNEICNSFIIMDKVDNKRCSNAFIEGKNRLCKEIKALACGMKNFELYRLRILYISDNNIFNDKKYKRKKVRINRTS